MLTKFLKDKCGSTAIEYALIATLIGLATIGGVTAISTNTTVTMTNLSDNL